MFAHNSKLAQVCFEAAVFRANKVERLLHEMVPEPGGHGGYILEVLVECRARDAYFFADVDNAYFCRRGRLHEVIRCGDNSEPGFELF